MDRSSSNAYLLLTFLIDFFSSSFSLFGGGRGAGGDRFVCWPYLDNNKIDADEMRQKFPENRSPMNNQMTV